MRRKLPIDTHQKLLTAFRESPHVGSAATAAGVSRPTASRAWRDGLLGHPPIREMLEKERLRTREILEADKLAAARAAGPELALDHAARQAADEVKIIEGVSQSVLDLQKLIGPLRSYAATMVKSIYAARDKVVEPGEALKRASAIFDLNAKVADLGERAFRMERQRVGDPDLIIGVQAMQPEPPKNPAEVRARLERAAEAMAWAEESEKEVPDVVDVVSTV